MTKHPYKIFLAATALTFAGSAFAGISSDEANHLGQELTPVGAEKKGNADGSIPEWTGGGIDKIPASYVPGGHHPDPFADESPLFTITAENIAQYAEHLSGGQQAMFKTYPETYKMKVYPSHRTYQAPQWVYDRTRACAESANLNEAGTGVLGVHACYPFPIPKTGLEVLWNHSLRYQGLYRVDAMDSAAPDARGR